MRIGNKAQTAQQPMTSDSSAQQAANVRMQRYCFPTATLPSALRAFCSPTLPNAPRFLWFHTSRSPPHPPQAHTFHTFLKVTRRRLRTYSRKRSTVGKRQLAHSSGLRRRCNGGAA